MLEKSKKQTVREEMRVWARRYRWWIRPERFDGTALTYSRNIELACACLLEARVLCQQSLKAAR